FKTHETAAPHPASAACPAGSCCVKTSALPEQQATQTQCAPVTAPTASTKSCNPTSANRCSRTADTCQSAIKIDRSFTIQNELGPYKVTNVDVPCSLSVRKKPNKDPKAPPSYSCTPNPDMACYSGITVSAGIDLSQQSIRSLNSMGINATQNVGLFNLLKPYLPPPQRTGCNAEIYLLEHPMSITATQAQTFDNLAYASYEGQVVKAFDDETGQNFALLPAPVQTTLFDYYYWHGNILALVPDIKSDDWNGVVADLHAMQSNFKKGSDFYNRYKREADKLQSSISDGSLKEYTKCLKK
ncbi:pesticin C-terminus-like muramidase, partial [Acidithiobacillus sulfurivorans]|uniref:pesticin C-terminus-like muramidase n=1 Tax=Acidithiobacillus sulfurivorans TaxID=1958756 RepID=UPI001C07D627